MQCFIKSLLGLEESEKSQKEGCTVLPPIVRSLVGSTIFIILMALVVHLIKV